MVYVKLKKEDGAKRATPAGKCLLTGIGMQRVGHGGLDRLASAVEQDVYVSRSTLTHCQTRLSTTRPAQTH
jgi:hypothetical protein